VVDVKDPNLRTDINQEILVPTKNGRRQWHVHADGGTFLSIDKGMHPPRRKQLMHGTKGSRVPAASTANSAVQAAPTSELGPISYFILAVNIQASFSWCQRRLRSQRRAVSAQLVPGIPPLGGLLNHLGKYLGTN
jgi:hypothetical protein